MSTKSNRIKKQWTPDDVKKALGYLWQHDRNTYWRAIKLAQSLLSKPVSLSKAS